MRDEKDISRSFTTTDSYSYTVGPSQDRPVLDQDIINEPTFVGSIRYDQDVMGSRDASTARSVLPPDKDLNSLNK